MYAAFDAAGDEISQRNVVVAGFISKADDWGNFDLHWRAFKEFEKYPPGELRTYTPQNMADLEQMLAAVGNNPNVESL